MAFEILDLPKVILPEDPAVIKQILAMLNLDLRRISLNFKNLILALGSGGTLGIGAAGRVPYFDASGNLTSGLLLFDGSQLTAGDSTPYTANLGLSIKKDGGVGSGEHFIAEFYRTNGGTAQLLLGYRANGSAVTGQLIRAGNSLPLFLGTSSANQAICIFNGGNVAIGGTTDNGFLLEATGTAKVSGALTASGGVVFAGGGTNLNHYEEGTFTFTATGMTTSPTGTAKYIRIGKHVTLMFPSILGTSNTTAFTLTGLPSAIQPATSQEVKLPWVQNNSADSIAGSANVTSSGTVTLSLNDNPIGWTAALGKGIAAASPVSYLLT